MVQKKEYPLIPNRVTRTLLCLDREENWDYCGRLYNPFFQRPVEFHQLKDVIDIMEHFFDDISYPRPYFQVRSFLHDAAPPSPQKPDAVHRYSRDDEIFGVYTGALATFEMQVEFRLKISWQGSLVWREKNETRQFRSMLEFIKLVDSALQKGAFISG